MSSFTSSFSPLNLDAAEDYSDHILPTQPSENTSFSRILNQVSKADCEIVECNFELDDEIDNSEEELIAKTRMAGIVSGIDMLNFSLRNRAKNLYIKQLHKKKSISDFDNHHPLLNYQQANYSFHWVKIEIERLKVKTSSYVGSFNVFNYLMKVDLSCTLESKYAVLGIKNIGFNNVFKEFFKIENYTQQIHIQNVTPQKFDISSNYFNQIAGLRRYRVYYKKKYYIFDFDDGKLVNFIRGNNDSS